MSCENDHIMDLRNDHFVKVIQKEHSTLTTISLHLHINRHSKESILTFCFSRCRLFVVSYSMLYVSNSNKSLIYFFGLPKKNPIYMLDVLKRKL